MAWWPFNNGKLGGAWAVMWALVRDLFARIGQLEREVKELKGRLAQDSHNDQRPPASDGLGKPPARSLRRPGGRKPGGQPGHAGRTLERVAEPDHLAVHPLEVCPRCGGPGLGREAALDYEARQVFELPPRPLEVTEHRAPVKCCPHCGEEVRAAFPAGVDAPVQYGPRFQGLLVYLSQQQLPPHDRLARLCADLFGQQVSAGTVLAARERVATNLEPVARELAAQVSRSPVVHLDESGLRVGGQLHWLHVAATDRLTCYGVPPRRGTAAMDALGVVGACRQWVVHDHWKPYFAYPDCRHALGHAHLLRELKFLWEEAGEGWARQLGDLLLAWEKRRQKRGEFTARQFQRARRAYRAAGRRAQSKAANLLDRLEEFDLNILAFLGDGRVPFTNNQAEQDIRMIKVQQKISGCFRTLRGAQSFCRIRSYLSTCRKQGRNLWEALQLAVQGTPFLPSVPAAGQ